MKNIVYFVEKQIENVSLKAAMIPYMLMPNSYLIKRDKFKIVNRVGVGVGRWSHAKGRLF